ncbi:MAG: DUF2029 domain-containing protein [Chloroflexi bacterium]|nr:DUF2029 domain-containing protein [Chloroflexota bacterium]
MANSNRLYKFSFVEVLAFLLISGQVALYAFMWLRLLGDPSLKTMDFVSFYAAGRLIRAGEYRQIYNFESEAALQRGIVGGSYDEPLIFNHPPHVTPLLALTASGDYVRAYIGWSAIRLLVVLACGELVRRYLIHQGWMNLHAWIGALGSVTFFPIFISLLGGQDTVFTLIGLLVWMFALVKGREMSAGLGLAFATLSPTIAGALALPLFASRRRAGLWFIAGCLGLAIYSLLLVGVQGLKDFLGLLRISSQGETYGFDWSGMYNLLGFLVRAFPSLGIETARSIAWGAAVVSIFVMCGLWWNKRHQINVRHIGVAVTLGTLTSPHLNLHGLSFLLLPLIGIVTILHDKGDKSLALILVPAISTVLVFALFFMPALNFAAYYLLMGAIFFCLLMLKSNAPPQKKT